MSTHYQRYRNELAGAYVLGTLQPLVRRRIERLLPDDAELAAAIVFWEAQFAQLALEQVVAVEPPAHIHGQLRQRIAAGSAPPAKAVGKVAGSGKQTNRFAWLFPTATALAAGFLLAILLRPAPAPELAPVLPAQLALISAESGAQLWLIGIEAAGKRMEVRNLDTVVAPAGKDYQLWALAKNDKPPVSLGLLPGARITERQLTDVQRAALAEAGTLAISEEPTGGSSTGAPTGPVVYTAPLVTTSSS